MPGREYWKKRMEEIEKRSHSKGLKYAEYAEEQFRRAQANIDKEIGKWYAKMADANGISYEAAQELLRRNELEEFHWSVEEYIKKGEASNYTDQWKVQLQNASAKVHISRLEAMKLQMQQECELLYGNLHDGLDEKLKEIYTEAYYRTAFEIQRGIGVGYAFNRLDTRRIEEAMDTAWAMDGRNFSDRLWQDKEKLVRELNAVLTQGIIMGGDFSRLIERLAKRLNVSKHNAGRLIMTEAAAIHARSQERCYKELDVKEFEFLATLDNKTSEICQQMDGMHFPMDQYEIGVTAPPLHPWCRSCTIPYFEDDNADSKRAARGEDGKTYLVPADMTYEEWKKTVDNASEGFAKSTESSTIISGAVSGARNPYGDKAKEHAERYYGLVRKMTTDVDRISKTTGIPKDKVQDIKNFIFLDKHSLGGSVPEYFAPDYMMAESWRRLIDGKPEPHDITLLNHEMMEKELMKKGMSQQEAHNITSKKYNYDKEAGEFYGKIKKYRKE